MRKIVWLFLMASVLTTMMFDSPAMSAQEDTAQLTFSKTAVSKKQTQTYTVPKGEVLSAIVRRIPGITEKDIPHYYRMIKELNPDIEDLNKLYEGQQIVLPGKSIASPEENNATPALSLPVPESAGSQSYRIKKGDSLIRIVHRELHITSNTQKTLLLIKSLNPTIKDVNKIYSGQTIHLPDGRASVKTVPDQVPSGKETSKAVRKEISSIKIIEEKTQAVDAPPAQQEQQEIKAEGKNQFVMSPAARLAVIKHVVTQMNGTMITSGNYYLPVSKTEQLTIDCSVIPVVEMDDRTTIFLDMEDRSNEHLKKMISDRWSNHHLVKIDVKDDIIVILKKILKTSKTYEITKAQKPVSIGLLPPVDVAVDWLISGKDIKQTSLKMQGLVFVDENTALLPRAIVNYARKHALIITEISPEKGLLGKPEEIYSLPPMTILPKSSARDFSYALLAYLNVPAQKDVDVRVFNIAQDGFNLSIKADIVVTHGDKKYILFSRNLPPQFINILQKAGNELLFVADEDEPQKNMEKILRTFSFVFTPGYFSFSGLDKNQPPYSLGFSGLKIKTDRDIYVVNFDFNEDLRGLLKESWSANIIRY